MEPTHRAGMTAPCPCRQPMLERPVERIGHAPHLRPMFPPAAEFWASPRLPAAPILAGRPGLVRPAVADALVEVDRLAVAVCEFTPL